MQSFISQCYANFCNVVDPRLHRIVAAQPYPLSFATINGRISVSTVDSAGSYLSPDRAIFRSSMRDQFAIEPEGAADLLDAFFTC